MSTKNLILIGAAALAVWWLLKRNTPATTFNASTPS